MMLLLDTLEKFHQKSFDHKLYNNFKSGFIAFLVDFVLALGVCWKRVCLIDAATGIANQSIKQHTFNTSVTIAVARSYNKFN